jgi:hypothetical protein
LPYFVKPRESVFQDTALDAVYNFTDFVEGKIYQDLFFAEHFKTTGIYPICLKQPHSG